MLLGYNTNGFAHHRLEDAIKILADLGYQCIGLTLDYHVLNPYEPDLLGRTSAVRELLQRLGLRSVIETGARFLLDPRQKHQPTLVSAKADERETRLDFLKLATDVACELESDAISFWSGATTRIDTDKVVGDLADGCVQLCDYAEKKGVRLAFEPEPGMVVDTMDRFHSLYKLVSPKAGDVFGLTIDIGHLHCQGELPIADHLKRWSHCLYNVHIEDMRQGVHDHLMFGEGEIDFASVVQALSKIGYDKGVYVELSRHSHDAVNTARKSLAFLNHLIEI